MPMYEYTCLDCHERFEILRSISERKEPCKCPRCGSEKKHAQGLSVVSSLGGFSSSGGGGVSSSSCSSGFG